jgi:hypothetical protein
MLPSPFRLAMVVVAAARSTLLCVA